MATPPKKPTTRRTTSKGADGDTAGTATDTATGAAGAAKAAASDKSGGAAAKPKSTRRATSARKSGSGSSAKAARPAAAAKSTAGKASDRKTTPAKRTKSKSPVGLKTAIAAGIGAVGAVATAALLTLRGSTPKDQAGATDDMSGAAQADGTDASKSFAAGIADEGTIPQR